jgi:translation initiation factor 1
MLPWGPMSDKRDSAFSALKALRDKLPAGPRSVEPMPAADKPPGRAVVRYERKHRGGKEVTLVEKLGLSADDLARWCRELKQALGCGGVVEQDAIVLQGDQRKRVPALLEKRGVAKVTVS